jgi:hypothetical protein
LGVAVAAALTGTAPAQLTVEQGASILVFPRVIADGATDTVVQIVNQSTSAVYAHCLYVSGGGSGSAAQEVVGNFSITLTRLQPTHWVASRGRQACPIPSRVDPSGPNSDCAGFSPRPVPALPSGFQGELLCIETDSVGEPISGNDLIGKVTLQNLTTGDLVTYNAIGIPGLPNNNGDNVLCLGGGVSDTCPAGAEYAACPQAWILSGLAEGAEDPVAGAGSTAPTSITVVPCSQSFDSQNPEPIIIQVTVTSELEEQFSDSTTVQGWADIPLSAISTMFQRPLLGTDYVQTRFLRIDSSGGFMLVARTVRQTNGTDMLTATTTVNLHQDGVATASEIIVVPTPPAQ